MFKYYIYLYYTSIIYMGICVYAHINNVIKNRNSVYHTINQLKYVKQ